MLLVPQRVAAVAPPCVSCPQHVQQAVTVCLDLPTAWHPEGMHKPTAVADSHLVCAGRHWGPKQPPTCPAPLLKRCWRPGLGPCSLILFYHQPTDPAMPPTAGPGAPPGNICCSLLLNSSVPPLVLCAGPRPTSSTSAATWCLITSSAPSTTSRRAWRCPPWQMQVRGPRVPVLPAGHHRMRWRAGRPRPMGCSSSSRAPGSCHEPVHTDPFETGPSSCARIAAPAPLPAQPAAPPGSPPSTAPPLSSSSASSSLPPAGCCGGWACRSRWLPRPRPPQSAWPGWGCGPRLRRWGWRRWCARWVDGWVGACSRFWVGKVLGRGGWG